VTDRIEPLFELDELEVRPDKSRRLTYLIVMTGDLLLTDNDDRNVYAHGVCKKASRSPSGSAHSRSLGRLLTDARIFADVERVSFLPHGTGLTVLLNSDVWRDDTLQRMAQCCQQASVKLDRHLTPNQIRKRAERAASKSPNP
jgi:hypothetical protein